MNSRDLNVLAPFFLEKILELRKITETDDYRYDPHCTYRPIAIQAALYCQGRTKAEKQKAITKLEKAGAVTLAQELHIVPAKPKERKVTWALPGESWHGYSLAVDFHCLEKSTGKALWGRDSYRQLADAAESLGLTSGLRWKTPDAPHIQYYDWELRSRYSWKELDDIYKKIHKTNSYQKAWEYIAL